MQAEGLLPRARKPFALFVRDAGFGQDMKRAGAAWRDLPGAEKEKYRLASAAEFAALAEAKRRCCPPASRRRRVSQLSGSDAGTALAGQTASAGATTQMKCGCFEWSLRPEHLLGRGTYGAVFAARMQPGGVEVAVKVYHAPDEQGRELRFLRQFESCGGPGRPFLKVFGQDGESVVRSIFVERCDFALSHVLRNRLPLRAPNVFHQVQAALRAMHLQHVAHCDVKPANILWLQLTSRAVLCDFSLAADWTKEATTHALCTLNYRPPEAFGAGPYPVSAAADVWAFGCTLWEVGRHRESVAPPAGRGSAAPAGEAPERPRLFPGMSEREVRANHTRFVETGRVRARQAFPFDRLVLAYCCGRPTDRVLDQPLCDIVR